MSAPSSPLSKLRFAIRIILVRLRFVGLLVAAVLAVAYLDTIRAHVGRYTRPDVAPDDVERGGAGAAAGAIEFYCPMHPGVVRAEPGSCPICGMPLARRKKTAGEALPDGVLARVDLTPYRVRLAGIETVRVERRPLERTIDTIGTIEVDERRVRRLSARVAGRVEKLHVNFTGVEVKADAPLYEIYSPDLLESQKAYLVELERVEREIRTSGEAPRATLEAVRQRLLLWGIRPEQIEELAKRREPSPILTIHSPIAGTVIAKDVYEGRYVQVGDDPLTVADLGVLWMVARVYEDEIGLVRLGAPVEIRSVAYPGQKFDGHVSFIDPMVEAETRTVRVRVDVENSTGLLKPGMYVRAVLRAPIGADGRVARAQAGDVVYRCCSACPEIETREPGPCPKCGMPLTPVEHERPGGSASPGASPSPSPSPNEDGDEWVCECAMHPDEVVRAKAPGTCPRCGARLVRPGGPPGGPLAVPLAAVIDTGRRKVVYKATADGVYDQVEVELGPRAGEHYAVISGLAEGDRVVARGAFLVDAEARLNPGASAGYFGVEGGGHRHGGEGGR